MQYNPAAQGGMDFGGILDNLMGHYATTQKLKNERDAIRYATAGRDQQATLHDSEAMTTGEAYATGNARVEGAGQSSMGGYIDQIPKPLLYGSLGLLGVGLLLKAVK